MRLDARRAEIARLLKTRPKYVVADLLGVDRETLRKFLKENANGRQ